MLRCGQYAIATSTSQDYHRSGQAIVDGLMIFDGFLDSQ
jgi:hypothetical protein